MAVRVPAAGEQMQRGAMIQHTRLPAHPALKIEDPFRSPVSTWREKGWGEPDSHRRKRAAKTLTENTVGPEENKVPKMLAV